jgi:hypothetical protein
MKALVMALFLFTTALSYALGEIVTPAMVDPNLIWVWAVPTVVLAVQTVIFHIQYRKLDHDEFMTYEEDAVLNEKKPEEEEVAPESNAKDFAE